MAYQQLSGFALPNTSVFKPILLCKLVQDCPLLGSHTSREAQVSADCNSLQP